MTSTGTLLRIIGAAMLLIVVQFASVAANAHAGHGHALDGRHQAHGHHAHGTAAGNAPSISSAETAAANRAVEAAAAAQNTPGAPSSDVDACVMGCCGYTGCCGAALAAVSPSLPPKACPLRIGFVRLVSVRGVDPQGLRKPPRFLA